MVFHPMPMVVPYAVMWIRNYFNCLDWVDKIVRMLQLDYSENQILIANGMSLSGKKTEKIRIES